MFNFTGEMGKNDTNTLPGHLQNNRSDNCIGHANTGTPMLGRGGVGTCKGSELMVSICVCVWGGCGGGAVEMTPGRVQYTLVQSKIKLFNRLLTQINK